MRRTESYRSLSNILEKAAKDETHCSVTLSQPHLHSNNYGLYRVRTSPDVDFIRQESEAVDLPREPLIGPM